MDVLYEKIIAIPDSYFDFVMGVINYAEKKPDRLETVLRFLDETSNPTSSDVVKFIMNQPDFHEYGLGGINNVPKRRQTWDEIVKEYPNQWVGLTEVQWSKDNNASIDSAVVSYHGLTKAETTSMMHKTKGKVIARYTEPNKVLFSGTTFSGEGRAEKEIRIIELITTATDKCKTIKDVRNLNQRIRTIADWCVEKGHSENEIMELLGLMLPHAVPNAQDDIIGYVNEKKNNREQNPFEPLSAEEIYAELAESRACYERGEYEDFDDALDAISKKYGL